jgi:hypothetical protein
MPANSRVVERSDTPGLRSNINAHDPGGVAAPSRDATTPPGSANPYDTGSGGVAALNHRLIALTPSGVNPRHAVNQCPADGVTRHGGGGRAIAWCVAAGAGWRAIGLKRRGKRSRAMAPSSGGA